MARPLRYEAANAVFHVMARGDGGKDVFEDDKDRFAWTDLLERANRRFGWRIHAWVLMGNHFHLLLETPQPNLVAGMKWILGVYSQAWNRGAGAGAGMCFRDATNPWWSMGRGRTGVISKS